MFTDRDPIVFYRSLIPDCIEIKWKFVKFPVWKLDFLNYKVHDFDSSLYSIIMYCENFVNNYSTDLIQINIYLDVYNVLRLFGEVDPYVERIK